MPRCALPRSHAALSAAALSCRVERRRLADQSAQVVLQQDRCGRPYLPFMGYEVIAHTPSPVPLTDWTFHHTCNDLATRVQQAQNLTIDRYTLLGCAGLLRKLLLDERPLATQANRQRRLAFNFAAHQLGQTVLVGDSNDVEFGVWFQGPSMFPGNSPTPLVRMTRVGKWVAHVTGRVGGRQRVYRRTDQVRCPRRRGRPYWPSGHASRGTACGIDTAIPQAKRSGATASPRAARNLGIHCVRDPARLTSGARRRSNRLA